MVCKVATIAGRAFEGATVYDELDHPVPRSSLQCGGVKMQGKGRERELS
jgi:hypothetical protein